MEINVRKLKGKMVECGYNVGTISEKIGMNRATFFRKIKAGGSFKVGEMHALCDALSLTNEEAVSIFLPKYSQKCENSTIPINN